MKSKIIHVIIIPFVLFSCTKTMYVPNMINVPMFEKKGQLNATLTFRDLQFAYAATNSIGFTLNGNYRSSNLFHLYDGKTGGYQNLNQGVDMAITFYKVMPKSISEFLIGYGQGFTSFEYNQSSAPSNSQLGGSSHFRKIYIQGDIAWFGRKTTTWAITTKLDFVTLYDFKDVNDTPIQSATSAIFSPGLTMRKKMQGCSFLGQIQISLPSAVDDSNFTFQYGDYPPFHSMVRVNFGIVIHINPPYKKEETNQP